MAVVVASHALLNLLKASGPVKMTKLSKSLHITKPAVTHLVDKLEKGRYLRRVPHAQDRRSYMIEMLPKGFEAVRRMQATILEPLLKTLNQFGFNERGVITNFYSQLSVNIEERFKKK